MNPILHPIWEPRFWMALKNERRRAGFTNARWNHWRKSDDWTGSGFVEAWRKGMDETVRFKPIGLMSSGPPQAISLLLQLLMEEAIKGAKWAFQIPPRIICWTPPRPETGIPSCFPGSFSARGFFFLAHLRQILASGDNRTADPGAAWE
ncbi:uncharacterized protein LOC128931725 [Callithrix jacchus]